jgi:hypothetical protein
MSAPSQHDDKDVMPADATVVAHLNMLQGVIARLAGNSASCKTWCSGLVTALWGLGAARAPQVLPLALVPVLVFAFLDAYYLAQERHVRQHYQNMASKIQVGTYSRADLFTVGTSTTIVAHGKAAFSWSIWPYYTGLAVACCLAMRMVFH